MLCLLPLLPLSTPRDTVLRVSASGGGVGGVFPADPLPELRMTLPGQSCMHSPESHTLAHAGVITHEHPKERELDDTDVQGDPLMLYHRHGPPVPPGWSHVDGISGLR